MKRFGIVIIITLFSVLGLGFMYSNDWIVVEFYDFKIEFPRGPKYKNERYANSKTEMTIKYFHYDASSDPRDENSYYTLRCYEFQKTELNSDSLVKTKKIMQRFIDARVETLKGRFMQNTVITNTAFPGREYKLRIYQGQSFSKERIFVANSTLYHIYVIGELKRDNNPAMDRFLRSFTILE
jgi:hypothetical protein